MRRTVLTLSGIGFLFLSLTAFTPVFQEAESNQGDWQDLVLVFLLIFIVTILIILMSRQTPKNTAGYNLDVARWETGHDEWSHGGALQAAHGGETSEEMPISSDSPDEIAEVAVEEKADAIAVEPEEILPPDDLTIIEGIGPKINELLNAAGITRFDQLAGIDVERAKEVLEAGGPRFALADPQSWKEQARLAADGEWDKLKEYQNSLKGGREAS